MEGAMDLCDYSPNKERPATKFSFLDAAREFGPGNHNHLYLTGRSALFNPHTFTGNLAIDTCAPGNPAPDGNSTGNPAIDTSAMGNPALVNNSTGNSAIDTSAAMGNPAIDTSATDTSAMGNPALVNPYIGNSAIYNPSIGNPALGTPALDNSSTGNPAFGTTFIGNSAMATSGMANNNFGYYMPMAYTSRPAFAPPTLPLRPHTFFPQYGQRFQSTNLAFAATGNPIVQYQQQQIQHIRQQQVRQQQVQQQQAQQPFNLNLGQQQPASMQADSPSRPEAMRQRVRELFFDLHPELAMPAMPATPATSEHQTTLNAALAEAFQKGAAACRYRMHSNLVADMFLRKEFFGMDLAALGLEITPGLSAQLLSWIRARCQFLDAMEPKTVANEIRTKYETRFPKVFVPSSSAPSTPPSTVPFPTLPSPAVSSSTVTFLTPSSSTDTLPAPAASPTRNDNGAKSPGGNGKPASKGKARANETSTLTGESVQRRFDERFQNAQERTEMAPQPQASGSGSKRKQQPEGTSERPAKKGKTMTTGDLILPIHSPTLASGSSQPTGSAVGKQAEQAKPTPKRKPRGQKASQGPRAGKKKPQTGPLLLPTGTGYQQPTHTPQLTIDLTGSDDVIDLTAPAPAPATAAEERSADDERMAELLVFDKNMPTSMMMAFIRPEKNSQYSVPRAAAENGETDVGDLLRDPGHRSRAYGEYDAISDRIREEVVVAAAAAQTLAANMVISAAKTDKRAEVSQPEPEPENPTAQAEAETDPLFGGPVEEDTDMWVDFDAEVDKLLG